MERICKMSEVPVISTEELKELIDGTKKSKY